MDHVRQVCTFAKSIPGFKCLHHEVRLDIFLHQLASFNLHFFQDQVSLLKSCVFEVLLVRLSGLFDNQVSSPSTFGAGALYRHLPCDRCPSRASVLVNPEAEFERAPGKNAAQAGVEVWPQQPPRVRGSAPGSFWLPPALGACCIAQPRLNNNKAQGCATALCCDGGIFKPFMSPLPQDQTGKVKVAADLCFNSKSRCLFSSAGAPLLRASRLRPWRRKF